MNQPHFPKIAYTFSSQQAASQFLNTYSKSGTAYETAITPESVLGMKGSTAGLICLILVAGLFLIYVYQVNRPEVKEEK
jgi:hypothetical protein